MVKKTLQHFQNIQRSISKLSAQNNSYVTKRYNIGNRDDIFLFNDKHKNFVQKIFLLLICNWME